MRAATHSVYTGRHVERQSEAARLRLNGRRSFMIFEGPAIRARIWPGLGTRALFAGRLGTVAKKGLGLSCGGGIAGGLRRSRRHSQLKRGMPSVQNLVNAPARTASFRVDSGVDRWMI